jgi:hypothetical protein
MWKRGQADLNVHLRLSKKEAKIATAFLEAYRPESREDIGFAPVGLDEPYRVIISEDPIGLNGGDINYYAYTDSVGKPLNETNLYMYAGDNPVNRKDPTGLMSPVVGGVIGVGGIGAVCGFSYCMDHCMPGGIKNGQKKDPSDPNWNNRFAQCAKLCVTPTGLWEFMIEPLGASLKAIIEGRE